MKTITCCSICGCEQFTANQVCHMEVIVDGNGEFESNVPGGIYSSEVPFEPFICKGCGAEFNELPIKVNDDWEKPEDDKPSLINSKLLKALEDLVEVCRLNMTEAEKLEHSLDHNDEASCALCQAELAISEAKSSSGNIVG